MRETDRPPRPTLVEERAALEAQIAGAGINSSPEAAKAIAKINGQLEAYGRLALYDPRKKQVYNQLLLGGPAVGLTPEEIAATHRGIGEMEVTLDKAGLSARDLTLRYSSLGEQHTRPATTEEQLALEEFTAILAPMKAARGDSGYDEPVTTTVTVQTLNREPDADLGPR